MISFEILDMLSRQDLLHFLNLSKSSRVKKELLLAQVQGRIAENEYEEVRLLDLFSQELAVTPRELEKMLLCSRIERQRWVKEGRIPVLEYRTFRVGSQEFSYAVHERRVVTGIAQEEVQHWREEYVRQMHDRRKDGNRRSAESRKTRRQLRQDFFDVLHESMRVWEQEGSKELALVFQLAYWTAFASRWAKENHVKLLRCHGESEKYLAQRDEWYMKKHMAMHVLAQTPYARLSLYKPQNADKIVLHLCEEHYEEMQESFYESKWQFYIDHAASVSRCHDCLVHFERDYYTLHFLEVTTEKFPDTCFAFHVPYAIGKRLFAQRHLPTADHAEQEGMFRFGRPITPYEKIVLREQDVHLLFDHALAEVRTYFQIDFPNMLFPIIEQS